MANQTWVTVLEHFMIICTIHTYFLSTDYGPDIVLGAGDIMINKSGKNPCPTDKLNVLMRRSNQKGERQETTVL